MDISKSGVCWTASVSARHRTAGHAEVADVFTPGREKASTETLKAAASELLLIYPLLRHFVMTVIVPTGSLVRESRSLMLLCAILDGMSAAKKGQSSDTVQITRAFLEAHKA